MYSTTCVDQSEAMGNKWLMAYKVQMILGMILHDRRYDGHVTIIPFYIMQIMERAFKAYRNCKQYDLARETVDAGSALHVKRQKKKGKGAEEIKDEEGKYMQSEWKQRFGNRTKEEWIHKYNVLQ